MTSPAGKLGRLLLVAALLAGGHAALVHPLEHVDEHGGFVHTSRDHDSGGDDGPLCDAIAAVAAAIGGAVACAAADSPAPAAVAAIALPARGNTPLAPSSRDPPELL
ncbi:MAG TPA: hypothetical protein VFS80_13710 [Burkholderiales bacterium]|nr:hypothetical protein [Burkholderiales bacterium]